jgi:hypothetical protein
MSLKIAYIGFVRVRIDLYMKAATEHGQRYGRAIPLHHSGKHRVVENMA